MIARVFKGAKCTLITLEGGWKKEDRVKLTLLSAYFESKDPHISKKPARLVKTELSLIDDEAPTWLIKLATRPTKLTRLKKFLGAIGIEIQ